MTVSFADVAAKLESGERLSDADVRILEADRDIVALGMLADAMRRKLHGSEVTYLRVADLNVEVADLKVPVADLKVPVADLKVGTTSVSAPTPIVAPTTVGSPAPVVAPTSVVVPTFRSARSANAADDAPLIRPAEGAGELRIISTPNSLETAVAAVVHGRDVAGSLPLSGFSLADLEALADPLPVVLKALKDAGLELIAFAPLDRLKHPERSLEAVTDAGLSVARVTLDEVPNREWGDVCRQLAAIQRRLQSLRAFAPLPRKINVTQPTTGYEDVKRVALSRLLAENVATIQVDWLLYGPKLAQVALMFGADDIDSVSAEDDDSQGRRRAPIEEIRRSIQAAGFAAVERDARFDRRD